MVNRLPGKSLLLLMALGACIPLAQAADAPTLNTGSTAWMVTAAVLVLFMCLPGLALFYGGLVRAKNMLSLFTQCFGIAGLVGVLWVIYGYSMVVDTSNMVEGEVSFNSFVGGLSRAFLAGMTPESLVGDIPEGVFVTFQMTFAIITPALITGAFADRMKFGPMLVFSGIWVLAVYAPVTHWVWGGGFLGDDGVLDFAGGTVVHINAGVAGLVAAIMLGRRSGLGSENLAPHNLVLSVILLLTFVVFGSFMFAMTTYASAFVDYILHFTSLSFGAYGPQSAADFAAALPADAAPYADALRGGATNAWGSFDGFKSGLEGEAAALSDDVLAATYAAGEAQRQFGWQAGWTTFYWAWWIAFSPFVGLFLARISRGRSVREFILGCVIAPALVCFAWMTVLGGTAIDLELNGAAEGAIIGASNTAKLFVTLQSMIDGGLLSGITIMCVVLILTFLVTSADSGILVMNTIMSGGDQNIGNKHKIVWGLILTAVIGTLLFAGKQNGGADPMEALKSAMIIGALPFTMVMGLMCVSLAKALFRDGQREKAAERAPAE